MLGMKNHFDISGGIEIREVDIAGVACIQSMHQEPILYPVKCSIKIYLQLIE